MAEGVEIPEVHHLTADELHSDSFGRRIAVAAVLTTLAAALIAFLQAGALRSHDEADQRAERLGAIALTQAAGQRGISQLQVDRFQLYRDDLARAASAQSVATYGGGKDKTAQLEADRWKRIARVTNADTARIARDDNVPAIAAQSRFGPDLDPLYPNRYVQVGQHSSYELSARREAANEEANAAESRFVHYAASLTMFAVAVFLLGYSLTPQGRPRRRLFTRVAGAFAAVAALWAVTNALNPITHAPAMAATAFADGQVAVNTENYPTAIARFGAALKDDPGLVDAHVQRAAAEFAVGQPVPDEASIPSVAALESSAKDDKKAIDLGSESPALINDLGGLLFYLGVRKNDDGLLRESIQRSEEAAARLPDDATPAYDIALARLALGDFEKAKEEFAAAIARTVRRPPLAREGGVSSALTDLALVRQLRPARAGQVAEISDAILTGAATGSTTANNSQSSPAVSDRRATFNKVSMALDPGHAQVVINAARGFDPARDRLSEQWYQVDPRTRTSTVLGGVSGPITGGLDTDFTGLRYSSNPSYLSLSARPLCLPEGNYRVDLYANGHLAGHADGRSDWHGLRPVQIRDLRVAFCAPRDMKPVSSGAGSASQVFIGGGGKSGAAVFALPKSIVAGASAKDLTNTVVSSFGSGSGLLPGLHQTLSRANIFANFASPLHQEWSYRGGSLTAGAGVSPDRRLYIALAWGPGDGSAETQLINSFSQLG